MLCLHVPSGEVTRFNEPQMQSSLPPDLLINSSSWDREREQERVTIPFMSVVAAPAAPVGLRSAPTSIFDQLNGLFFSLAFISKWIFFLSFLFKSETSY